MEESINITKLTLTSSIYKHNIGDYDNSFSGSSMDERKKEKRKKKSSEYNTKIPPVFPHSTI